MNHVSIIIPTFNREKILEKVLNSLISQDNIFEILVIDSNSEDGTKNLVDSFNLITDINVRYFE